MRLTLPVPPSANRYWRNFRGRTVVSAEARAYKTLVKRTAAVMRLAPLVGPVRLAIRWYRERKAGDLSNRIKVLEDALCGVAFLDDSQVVRIEADRYDDKANPRVEIHVEAA